MYVISFSRVCCYINGIVIVVYFDGGDFEDFFIFVSFLNLVVVDSIVGLVRFVVELFF